MILRELLLKKLCYKYPKSKHLALEDIDADFSEGTIYSITGQSGAGKSTLLYILMGMDVPVSGEMIWNGSSLKPEELSDYRRNDCGMIAQSFLLFPFRTALENVSYPLCLQGVRRQEAEQIAEEKLRAVGLGPELDNRLPSKLSGGEKQRVAIARCLAGDYGIILADEPTGNLDHDNSEIIVAHLRSLAYEHGKIVILTTHDLAVAEIADVKYSMVKGRLSLVS